ncbi:hypothetical protein [Actinomycetospora lemnae]|uniref:Uncharacterized protein n=1 Tax=Actinomycetospora lemnae TaxID=3019891 RepID=A0ABT5T2G0_9PSEU|nr:hypothetical protein [Actinomycetospora sp. DW7H6]MDD7969281.1 hypothetical protein [Actinomycetospora sp. DW7H6]
MARRSSASPAAVVVGAIVAIGVLLLILKWLLITAAILAVPFGLWWAWDRAAQERDRRDVGVLDARRRELESRAVLDPAGGCAWCGMPRGHRDHRTGARVTPRAFHRLEIEQTLDALRA